MLIEIARKVGNYVPDLSFGTHFFQDLVEARIRYLALYPDEERAFSPTTFSANRRTRWPTSCPNTDILSPVVRVIDVPAATGGLEVRVIMDGDRETALGFLCDPAKGRGGETSEQAL